MFDFPLPYRDELLYSVIARYGVHQGIISPKELLDDVYNDRKIVATVDLPSHVNKISSLYPQRKATSSIELIYSYTLFPLYAPFVDDQRRKKCIKFMQREAKGSTHLSLGVAASRIKQPRWLRYCPSCLVNQKETFGEYYWLRNFQVSGADSCFLHGELVDSNLFRHPDHKHEYSPATHYSCKIEVNQQPNSPQSDLITQSVDELLQLKPFHSPTLEQWSYYYRSLLFDHGLNRGNHIDYSQLKEKVIYKFGSKWLKKYDLYPKDSEICWLKTIFRKHRKAFSYLEHLVVWHSILGSGWQVADIFKQVCLQPKENKASVTSLLDATERDKTKYRGLWLVAVVKNGANCARRYKYGDVYAWLYRHDRDWLLQINNQYKAANITKNPRIDWHKRDRHLIKLLCRIKDDIELQLDDPRHSMNWYLSKLYCGSTVGKHLNDLPLCKLFFMKFCENIDEYQIRRITCAVIAQSLSNNTLRRWKILRMSGLSDQRLTSLADTFLLRIIRI